MKALIVDDEPMPAKHLRELIHQYCFEINEVEIILSPKKALDHLKENHYELLFLDVEMPEINGVEFLKSAEINANTAIIFTTAYSEYAVEAFKANATHYIMKPVEKDELITAVRKSLVRMQNHHTDKKESKISVFDGDEYVLIKQEEIIRLQADGSYTKFVLKDRDLLTSKRIGHYQDKLDDNQFIRCHKTHLVNREEVSKLRKSDGGFLVMTNGDQVPISSTKREEIEKWLGFS